LESARRTAELLSFEWLALDGALSVARGKPIAQVNCDWRIEEVIRINLIQEHSALQLIVEGTLSGVWVEELEKCWLETRSGRDHEQLSVDLSGVSYIDDKGRQLLRRMFQEGADLRATGVMTRGIIDEITGDGP